MMNDSLSSLLKNVEAPCIDCGAMGTVAASLIEIFRCPSCGRKHYEQRKAEEDRRRQASERISISCQQRKLEAHGFQRPGTLELAFEALTIDSFNQDAIDTAQEWAGGDDTGLWLYGPPGVGKTHLARTLLAEYARRLPALVAEIVAPTYLRRGRDWESGEEVIEALSEVAVLLLDDIDKAITNESTVNAIWRLFNGRCEAGHRTIITSNTAPLDFARKRSTPDIAENLTATLDRLQPLRVLEMRGSSRRGRRAEKG